MEKSIPQNVFEAFNTLIERSFDGEIAIIKDEEITQMLLDAGYTMRDIYDKNLLKVETIYQKSGWIVEHIRQSYSHRYFRFSVKDDI